MEVFSLFGTLGLRGASDVKAQLQETSKQADNTAKTFDNSTERTGKSSQSLLAKIGAGFTQAGNVAGQFVAGSIRAIGNFGQSLENQGQKMINFGGGAKTALATVGLSVGTLAMSITAGMKRLDALNGANLVFQSMGAAADTSFGGISKAAKDMTKGTVMAVGDFNSKVQQYIAKGVPQAAAIATTALNAFVKGTSVGMTDAATATARFNSVGMDLNKSTTEFKNMTKVLAGTGNATAEGIDRASLAISQMAGKGKLDMGNMLQLMNTMPNALAFVSQSTGISMKDIQQAISDGKVSYEDFSKALQDQSVKVDEQFAKQGGVMAQTGKTFEGSISNMKAAVARFGASILEGIGQSKITDAMANIGSKIDETATKITPIIPKVVDFGTKLFNLAQKFAPVIGAFLAFKLGALGVGTVMKQVGSIFTTFAKNPILSIIMLLVAAFMQAYTHSETFRKAIQDLFSAIQNSGAMELLKIAFERISAVVSQVKDSVSKLWDNISKGTSTSNIIQTIVGFFNNLGLAVYDVVDFVTKLWESLQNSGALDGFKNAFKNTFSIISSLVSPVIDLVKKLWDKISEAGSQQAVIETLEGAFSEIGATIESVTGFVKGLVDWFKQGGTGVDVLKAAFVGLGTILGGYAVYQGILKGIALAQQAWAIATGVWSAITSGATAIQMAFNAAIAANPIGIIVIAIMAVVAALIYFFTQTTAGKQIWEGFMNWLQSAWTSISSFFSGLWQGIIGFFRNAGSTAQNIWNSVVSFFQSIPGKISGFFSGIGSAIGGFFTSAGNNIRNIFNAVVSFVSSIPGRIIGFFSGIGSAIGGFFTSAGNNIRNIFNAVVSFVSSIPGRIIGFFSSVGSAIGGYFNNVSNNIRNAFNNAVSFVSGIPSKIAGFFSGIGDRIADFFRGIPDAIGAIFSGIKVPTLHISGSLNPVDWVKNGKMPKIDFYAKGGIMDGPTLFGFNGINPMIGGEAGREAVIPLNKETLGQIGDGIKKSTSGMNDDAFTFNQYNYSPENIDARTASKYAKRDGKDMLRTLRIRGN